MKHAARSPADPLPARGSASSPWRRIWPATGPGRCSSTSSSSWSRPEAAKCSGSCCKTTLDLRAIGEQEALPADQDQPGRGAGPGRAGAGRGVLPVTVCERLAVHELDNLLKPAEVRVLADLVPPRVPQVATRKTSTSRAHIQAPDSIPTERQDWRNRTGGVIGEPLPPAPEPDSFLLYTVRGPYRLTGRRDFTEGERFRLIRTYASAAGQRRS
jgi:hypothetical protein